MSAGDPYCKIHGQNPCFCTLRPTGPVPRSLGELCTCNICCPIHPPRINTNIKEDESDYDINDKEVVNIHFSTHPSIYKFVIEHYPQNTGDEYVGYSLDTKKRYRVQQFDYMEDVELPDAEGPPF